jgi:hypothetical protein
VTSTVALLVEPEPDRFAALVSALDPDVPDECAG